MIVAAPTYHDALPKRGSGLCKECNFVERTGELSAHGHQLLRCKIHGHNVRSKEPACFRYERSDALRSWRRVYQNRYNAEISTGVRAVNQKAREEAEIPPPRTKPAV